MSEQAKRLWSDYEEQTEGMAHMGSELRIAQVEDGTSNTYLVAEKNMNSDHYLTGSLPDDNENMYLGFNEDNVRWAQIAPRRDAPGDYTGRGSFGSAHPSGFHVMMADGSVRAIPYSIDLAVHQLLARRSDGQPVTIP